MILGGGAAGHSRRVVLAVLLVCAAVAARPPAPPDGASATSLRAAIYVGAGTCADKIAALFRAVAAAGHRPLGVVPADIDRGHLNRDTFDLFVLPAGERGSPAGYASLDGLGNTGTLDRIREFVASGGGFVGIEAGAAFAAGQSPIRVDRWRPRPGPLGECSARDGSSGGLGLMAADYVGTSPAPGIQAFAIQDPSFGEGSQAAYLSEGGGYLVLRPKALPLASDPWGRPVVARGAFGAGRVVLCAFDPELRADSDLDWTIWDNWAAGGVHPNSEGAWFLLGRMLSWAGTGDSSAPSISSANPPGFPVAVVSTHDAEGGASPCLLPAFDRAIEASGHVPLALRLEDIRAGKLTLDSFRAVAFPGGYALAYVRGLAGREEAVRSFVRSGGAYYGVCAGAYYAAAEVVWEGTPYDYPLGLFSGSDEGPLDEVAPWPGYALTPVRVSDPVLGDLGVQNQLYYGGGWKSPVQGAPVAATYEAAGPHRGLADSVRFAYGNGRVLLVGTHPESRAGSAEDWLYWDDWDWETGRPVANPDDPWLFVNAAFNRWLLQ